MFRYRESCSVMTPASFPEVLKSHARKISPAVLAAMLLFSAQARISAQQGSTVAAGPSPATSQHRFLNRYCVSCQDERLKTGRLSLLQVELSKPGAQPEVNPGRAETL